MRRLFLSLVAALAFVAPAAALDGLGKPWPSGAQLNGGSGQAVTFTSESPFGLSGGEEGASPPAATAQATLFLPPGASKDRPVPAVVMLHGSAGLLPAREATYGRQFAVMGIAALVVDFFAARRHLGVGFIGRLVNITEAMLIAEAYAGCAIYSSAAMSMSRASCSPDFPMVAWRPPMRSKTRQRGASRPTAYASPAMLPSTGPTSCVSAI